MWTVEQRGDDWFLNPPPQDAEHFVVLGPMPEDQAMLMRNWLNALQGQWMTYRGGNR